MSGFLFLACIFCVADLLFLFLVRRPVDSSFCFDSDPRFLFLFPLSFWNARRRPEKVSSKKKLTYKEEDLSRQKQERQNVIVSQVSQEPITQ